MPKSCPECSAPIPLRKEGQRGPSAVFCCAEHKIAFQNRQAVQGRAIIALAKAWRASRNRKEDSPIGKAALTELSAIIDQFNAEDRNAGRPRPTEYAQTLLNHGRYIDRMKER